MTAQQQLAVIIAFSSLFFMVIAAIGAFNAKEQESWPHVIGRITDSKSYFYLGGLRQSSNWKAKFDYEYYVNGIKYTGVTEMIKDWKLDAVKAVNQQPPDSRIPVYYAPNNPTESTIAPGQGCKNAIYFVLACLGFFIFSPMLALVARNK